MPLVLLSEPLALHPSSTPAISTETWLWSNRSGLYTPSLCALLRRVVLKGPSRSVSMLTGAFERFYDVSADMPAVSFGWFTSVLCIVSPHRKVTVTRDVYCSRVTENVWG